MLKNANNKCGAHPRIRWIGTRRIEDRMVGVFNTNLQGTPNFLAIGMFSSLRQPAAHFGLDEGNGHSTGDLTRVVATHAIGKNTQP